MKCYTFMGQFLFLLFLPLTPLGITYAEAADSPASSTSIVPSNYFNFTKPPAYAGAQQVQMSAIQSSCGISAGSVANAISTVGRMAGGQNRGGMVSQMMMGAGSMGALPEGVNCPFAAAASIDMVCPEIAAMPGMDPSMMMSGGMYGGGMYGGYGGYGDPSAGMNGMRSMICQNMNPSSLMYLEQAICSALCKQLKAQAVQAELQCIQAMGTGLSNAAKTLGTVYNTQYQNMKKQMIQINTAIADNQAQIEDISKTLGGDPSTGSPGLLVAQQNTQKLLNEMPTLIQELEQMARDEKRMLQSIQEQNQAREMALTMKCFSQNANSGFRCSPNGPPVSARDYILCRFGQEANLGKGRVIEQSAALKASAEANKAALANILDDIAARAPSEEKFFPTTQEEGEASANQGLGVLSVADISSQYGDRLAAFRIGKMNAAEFVDRVMNVCNARSVRQVQAETGRANTSQGNFINNLKMLRAEARKKAQESFAIAKNGMAEITQAMTGSGKTLDMSACESQRDLSVNANCLSKARSRFQDILSGQGDSQAISIMVRGNNAATVKQIPCRGLNQCIAALQGQSKLAQNKQPQLENFKKQYVAQAAAAEASFTQQFTNEALPQVNQLQQKLASVNKALLSLGQPPIDIPQAESPEDRQPDDDGLFTPPRNLLATLQIPNFSDGSFTSSMGATAGMTGDLGANLAQAISQYNMASGCLKGGPTEDLVKAVVDERLRNQADLRQANCSQHELCKNKPDQLRRDLRNALALARRQPMDWSLKGDFARLETGVASFCRDKPGVGQDFDLCDAYHSGIMGLHKEIQEAKRQQRALGGRSLRGR